MADGGGMGPLGIQHWAYYKPPPPKNNLGLKLVSSVVEQETEPYLLNGGSFPIEFLRDGSWINNRDTSSNQTKFLHPFPPNPSYPFNPSASNTLQILEQPNLHPKNDILSIPNEPEDRKEATLKKRSQGQANKSPKPKKPKKEANTTNESSQRKVGKKSEELVINGICLDLSEIPTPVCSCTGKPRQCYRWGVGGWQSACCTKSVSIYPLPLSIKRQGARIAGRKMSLGAFKKVLERLAGEGQNLSYPIDLKPYWAKHGTNKFVTIR